MTIIACQGSFTSTTQSAAGCICVPLVHAGRLLLFFRVAFSMFFFFQGHILGLIAPCAAFARWPSSSLTCRLRPVSPACISACSFSPLLSGIYLFPQSAVLYLKASCRPSQSFKHAVLPTLLCDCDPRCIIGMTEWSTAVSEPGQKRVWALVQACQQLD